MAFNTALTSAASALLTCYSYAACVANIIMASSSDSKGHIDRPRDHPDEAPAAPAPSTAASLHEPTVADVLVTKAMLSKALPREIVDIIIDLAEYWPRTTTVVAGAGSAIGSGGTDENVFVLRSPPLGLPSWSSTPRAPFGAAHQGTPPSPRPPGQDFSADDFQKVMGAPTSLLAHPCRRLVFTFRSHDQGWGGDPDCRGTYRRSWTWFEVGLERWCKPNPESAPQQQLPSLNVADLCTVIPQVQPRPNGNGYRFGHPLLPAPHLKIQCNVTASDHEKEHRVVWSYTDEVDPERDVEAAEALDEQGRGKATGDGKFVRDLKLGDVITVWSKARFPGWANHVQHVKLEVYYAV
ncbi:hypothetical protein VTJ83DRAFT_3689 [Remersonia thermophila]|uniref:Uncharacterized protein n=1 Tax=Remersonia thermophila TaxID=72144 RepID=A0ABR4DEN9_9PEZI